MASCNPAQIGDRGSSARCAVSQLFQPGHPAAPLVEELSAIFHYYPGAPRLKTVMFGQYAIYVWTIEDHLSPSCWFQNVVPTQGLQGTAAEDQIAKGIKIEQQTHLIHQDNRGGTPFMTTQDTRRELKRKAFGFMAHPHHRINLSTASRDEVVDYARRQAARAKTAEEEAADGAETSEKPKRLDG